MSEKRDIFPLVSIIIPTLNSGKTLNKCLQSIVNQSYSRIEIIVVDSGSIDNTTIIAKKYGAKVINCKERGITRQRNIGVFNSSGNWLLQIDSDEVIYHKLVEDCVNILFIKQIDGIFIPTIDTGNSYWGRSREIGEIINLKLRVETNIPNSALRFYSKTVFDKLNGYEENLVFGEDNIQALKCYQYGFKVIRCKYYLLHYATEGFRNIFLKKYSYGKTIKRFQIKAQEFDFQLSYTLIKTGLFYLKNLFQFPSYGRYIPGFFLIKFVEIAGLLLGRYNS
jgi:glycosyltransferase involved in cell wall biosynthesis